MPKNKQIHRWAACMAFDDVVIVAQATLVESAKQFRLKEPLGGGERQFSRGAGYRSRWDKDSYPSVGWATKFGALRGLVEEKRKEVERAEATLRARKRELEFVENQIYNHTYKTVRTEHAEA